MEFATNFDEAYRCASSFAESIRKLGYPLTLIDEDGESRLAFRLEINADTVVSVEVFWSEESGALMAVAFRNMKRRRVLASTKERTVIDVTSISDSGA
jgi:hypothetical protein